MNTKLLNAFFECSCINIYCIPYFMRIWGNINLQIQLVWAAMSTYVFHWLKNIRLALTIYIFFQFQEHWNTTWWKCLPIVFLSKVFRSNKHCNRPALRSISKHLNDLLTKSTLLEVLRILIISNKLFLTIDFGVHPSYGLVSISTQAICFFWLDTCYQIPTLFLLDIYF